MLKQKVDVLLVTAVYDEFEQVLEVSTGLVGGGWIEEPHNDFDVRRGHFERGEGQPPLVVVATFSPRMGGELTSAFAAQLLALYSPKVLAMSGICAGRRGEVALGDVIFAERMWNYESGKIVRDRDEVGKEHPRIQGDPVQYQIQPRWLQHLTSFEWPVEPDWLKDRPKLSLELQEDWVIHRIAEGNNPKEHEDKEKYCPDWGMTLERLEEKRKWVERQGTVLALTDSGQRRVDDHLFYEKRATVQPFQVHIGPIATGAAVVQDKELFNRLVSNMRKLLGLEMEISAMAALASISELPFIAAKGVVDFADEFKDDRYRKFAARASAECLLLFLRKHAPSWHQDTLKLDGGLDQSPSKNLTPAQLLVARHGIVPFEGRVAELRQLDAWADGSVPLSVLSVIGEGGMGKTRLLAEWGRLRKQCGWQVGFVSGDWTTEREREVKSSTCLILIVDYAEAMIWLPKVLHELTTHKFSESARIRIVLAARHKGDWWASLQKRSDGVDALINSQPSLYLKAMFMESGDRVCEWKRAFDSFRSYLCLSDDVERIYEPPDLSDKRYERVLYIHMNALMSILDDVGSTTDDPRSRIFFHELRSWLRLSQQDCLEGDERDRAEEELSLTATALTLRGFTSEAEVSSLLNNVLPRNNTISRRFLKCFFIEHPSLGKGYRGVEPDLLGEYIIRQILESMVISSFIPLVAQGVDDVALRHMFIVLGRIEPHSPRLIKQCFDLIFKSLEGTLLNRATCALNAALALGEETAHSSIGKCLTDALNSISIKSEQLSCIAKPIFRDSVILREFALWCAEKRVENHLDDFEHAISLEDLCIAQSRMGDRDRALDTSMKAVCVRRKLALQKSESSLLALANGLNDLACLFSDLSQFKEAVKAAEEAVAILEELNAKGFDGSLRCLAVVCGTLGTVFLELKEYDKALGLMRKSVEFYEGLIEEGVSAVFPDLVVQYVNLGSCLLELKRYDEALGELESGVAIYRELTSLRPDSFLHGLSSCLNNLGVVFLKLGRYTKALEVMEESLEIRKGLANQRPDVFNEFFAESLCNYGEVLMQLDRCDEALVMVSGGVDVYRVLVNRFSGCFESRLAHSLNVLGLSFLRSKQYDKARVVMEESVCIYESLMGGGDFRSEFAYVLSNLGVVFFNLEMDGEAIGVTIKAVEMRRSLVVQCGDVFREELADSLGNLVEFFLFLGRYDEAIEAINESVGVYKCLLAGEGAFAVKLVGMLKLLAKVRCLKGDTSGANEALQEASAICVILRK